MNGGQLALVASPTPGDDAKGWNVCEGEPVEAHYFRSASSDRTACRDAKARKGPWMVERDVGKIPLCERCKGALMGRSKQ
jgi:hypothetical protein